jgi:hypothetical protein
MTTISTIGYYSNVKSLVGKISIIILLGIVITQVPTHSSKLVSLISSKSVYARRRYKSIDKVPHIVLIGSVSYIALKNFLEEYFHSDHGSFIRHCVVMQEQRPDPNAEYEFMRSDYSQNVILIEGDPLNPKDLKRCLVEKSKAVIILSDKLSIDA